MYVFNAHIVEMSYRSYGETAADITAPHISCIFHFSFLCASSGYKEDEFNWPSYLKKCKAQTAPKSLFENQNTVRFL